MASLKQKKGESLKQYEERALRLRQRLEETDDPFLVQRFRKGLRKKAERRLLASRTVGDKMVTMQKLNAQILSICKDDKDSSNESEPESEASDATQDSSTDDDDDEQESKRKKKEKAKAKKKAAKKKANSEADAMWRQLEEYAERLKKMEDEREALRVDTFNVQQGGK